MNSLKWFRLYNEFATDPKVQSMSEAMQRRLIMFFCMQSSGELSKLSDDEKAFFLRIDNVTLHETLQLFKEKGFMDENGVIINWDKRQYKSDSSAIRVKKYREKQRVNNVKRYSNDDVTPPDTDTDTDTDKKKIIKEKKSKGMRFQNWLEDKDPDKITEEWLEWALDNTGWDSDRIILEMRKFQDHWKSTPGQKGIKLDWDATWRNWIRNAMQYAERGIK